ncbi:MFS transporter, partial [Enterococcus faecium]
FIDNGIDKVHAGLLVGLMSLVGVPLSLFIAPMAARRPSQSGWILAVGLFGIACTIGMMVAPAAQPLLWSVLIGIGMSAFSM